MSLSGLRFYECPLSCISEDTREIMRICFLMDGANALYFNGGWAEQPAWIVEAFEIFKAEAGNVSRRNDHEA
ncbi:MAG: hypothetical protein HY884_06920 [Deltaproteobacteria bacterium]|nr:hypothetical protein [Deltaproteobacteria bacterium]